MAAQAPAQAPERGKDVLVFMEQTDGALEGVSLEVLGKAREIADRLGVNVVALLLGRDVSGIADEAARRGADVVLLADSPLLKDCTVEVYLKVLFPLVIKRNPAIILIGGTHNGTGLAAGLAVRLGAGLMAHVVDLEVDKDSGTLFGSVPGFGGSIVAICRCKKWPQMATVRPGIFKPLPTSDSGTGKVERVEAGITEADVKCRVIERSVTKTEDISRAERIVVAGLGTKGDLALTQKLAQALGASFGVSRPLADKGMAPRDRVVGSTGYSVNAELAIVAGVSGAAHFASGIRDAKTVIAINSDPNAQIFKHADYCVTGNLFEVMPELIAALQASKGGSR
ncbi:MAG: electron transfer flavoprotein subunit alpha/FixB family protein [Nitrososphaerales archaeon]